jgi:hypothetical protein
VGVGTSNALTLFGASQLNVNLTAQVLAVPAGGSVALFARYNAVTGNGYFARILSTYNATTKTTTYTAQLVRRLGGIVTVLASKNVSQLGTLSFNVTGNTLSLSLSGTSLTVNDYSIRGPGAVRLTGSQGTAFGSFSASYRSEPVRKRGLVYV